MTVRPNYQNLALFLTLAFTSLIVTAAAQTRAQITETSAPLYSIISGQVTDTNTKPLPGASIEIIQGEVIREPHRVRKSILAQTSSTVAGAYSLSADIGKSTKTFTMLQASKPGFATLNYFLWELMAPARPGWPDKSAITRAIVLPESAPISGTVTSTDGTPIPGATIIVTSTDAVQEGTVAAPSETTSTQQGRFEINTMPAGPFQVNVSLGDREMLITTGTAPISDLHLVISQQSGIANGTVINTNTGQPVAGATVTLYRKVSNGVMAYPRDNQFRTLTSNSGAFTFNNLPAGQFVFQPEASDLFPIRYILEQPATEISAGETTSGIIVKMAPGLQVSGYVYEAGTSTPISGVTVNWNSAWPPSTSRNAVSQADGKYRITGIPPYSREGFLHATADGFSMIKPVKRNQPHFPTHSTFQEPININFPPGTNKRHANIQMQPNRKVSGQVVDVDGNPLEGVEVSTKGGEMGRGLTDPIITGQDGRFTVSGPVSRDFVIFVNKPGWPVSSAHINAGTRNSSGTIITIGPGGSISGMVLTPDGQPAGNTHIQVNRDASVHITGFANNLPSARSRPDGTFLIKDLPAGKISLHADKPDYAPTDFIRLNLAPGEHRKNVTLQLHKGYTITGRVTDAADNPIAGARVSADSQDSDHPVFANTQTGLDGSYKLTGVPDQIITIDIWAPEQGKNARRKNIDPKAGPQNFNLE